MRSSKRSWCDRFPAGSAATAITALVLIWLNDNGAAFVVPNTYRASHSPSYASSSSSSSSSSWADLEAQLEPSLSAPLPRSIDSALDTTTPKFSSERPTLFRERHGWCPYSERVWLTAELGNIDYDTVRIDNTGHGPRPSYFGGQTPQMKWPESSRFQGESMDLVNALNERCTINLLPDDKASHIQYVVSQFSNIFPRARPSSRAAFLFQYNGEPLWKSTFEKTLQETDKLLAIESDNGPFFCGNELTVADIAWVPFLERYRYQLPCLHQGLQPDDPNVYPHLAAWYKAMDWQVPAYACRVKGDAASWRKVLTMAGFGNAGVPPNIRQQMDERIAVEEADACALLADGQRISSLWHDYASSRPFVASSPAAQAALIVTGNRDKIVADLLKRAGSTDIPDLPSTEQSANKSLQTLVSLLLEQCTAHDLDGDVKADAALARYLDDRMCVPRDMGAISAACIKKLAVELEGVTK